MVSYKKAALEKLQGIVRLRNDNDIGSAGPFALTESRQEAADCRDRDRLKMRVIKSESVTVTSI